MSLISTGMQEANRAQAGFGQAADLEQRRNLTNKRLRRARAAQKTQTVGSTTATGAAIGSAFSPGIGTAIGAAVGFLAGELFG